MIVATPHNGSSIANSGKVLANIISACSPFRPARTLLGSLRKDSKVLFEITEDFVEKLPKLQIVSFFEMEMTSFGLFKRLVRTNFHRDSLISLGFLTVSQGCGTALSNPQRPYGNSNWTICKPSGYCTIFFYDRPQLQTSTHASSQIQARHFQKTYIAF